MRTRRALWLIVLTAGCGGELGVSGETPGTMDGASGNRDGAMIADASAQLDMASGGDGPMLGGGGLGDMAMIPDGAILTHDGGAWCLPRTCQSKLYECGDCIDNDGDGRIDAEDPDCLGACQNNERGFSGNIPGQNNAPCKADCYFDQDTGSGNDTCEWDHRCDPHEVAPAFPPELGCGYDPRTKFPGGQSCADRMQAQPPLCKTVCGPLTPNGCDCFGCCVIPPASSMTDGVYLGSRDANDKPTCDLAHAGDPTRCKPCQIVPSCFKPCGRCQLCIGKTEVPPDCYGPPPPDGGAGNRDGGANPDGGLPAPDGGVPGQCPGGEQPCGLPGQSPCPAAFYCITGCCEPIIS